MLMARGDLDRYIRIERPVADGNFDGAGSGSWQLVAMAWAQVQDVLPSRGERLADGVNLATHPARVRMDYRADVNSNMRLVDGARIMQIVAGPATLGHQDTTEFMVEDYGSAGNTA